jgi:aminomethyltransferase
VLTTPIGRMVDRLVVYVDDDALRVVTSPGAATVVRNWLGRHIFFMDQVKVSDVSAETGLLRVVGPAAGERLAGAVLPEAPHDWVGVEHAGAALAVARADRLGADTFAVWGPRAALGQLAADLEAAGAEPAGDDLYDVLRIEAGLPRYGREIGEEYIPLEANLWADVSFNKGCYTGQEIIARMESRGKQARVLAGLRLAGPVGLGGEPVAVAHEGAAAGHVSSTAVSPALGPIALAFVKPAMAAPGTAVEVRAAAGPVAATVAALPFEAT